MLRPLRFKKSNSGYILPVKAKSALDRPLSIKLCWRYRRHVAFAIGSTLNRSPSSRVWFVVVGPPMPIISDGQSPALGRKVSDEFIVPLCRGHHREVHRCGDEAAWWKRTGIDPSAAARVLWLKTHPLPSAVGRAGSKLRNEANLEAGSL